MLKKMLVPCEGGGYREKVISGNKQDYQFELDLSEKRLEQAEKIIQTMIEVSEELNYRLRKTDQSEGFYGKIDSAREFLKERK